MLGDTIYEIHTITKQGTDIARQAYSTSEEAEKAFAEMESNSYIDRIYIKEKTVDTDFILPDPINRTKWSQTAKETSSGSELTVTHEDGRTFTFTRNYHYVFPRLFEPFQQFREGEWKEYALFSFNYMFSDVIDLTTGEVIATEPRSNAEREYTDKDGNRKTYGGAGFCPVAFFVPDWWDFNDGSIIPGSEYWEEREEGSYVGGWGLVFGCVWGDDNSWKMQYLDLSQISEGTVNREERFGYVEVDLPPSDRPMTDVVRIDRDYLTVLSPKTFKLGTGEKIAD